MKNILRRNKQVEPPLGDDAKINLHEYLRKFDGVISILVSVVTHIEKI
jgi:hypothetical protein